MSKKNHYSSSIHVLLRPKAEGSSGRRFFASLRMTAGPLILILSFYIAAPVPLAEAFISLSAPSAVLLEPDSQTILFSRDPHSKRPPASTTKLVTALVVLDFLTMDHWVTVSSAATAVEASKLYLRSGDKLRVRDLLRAILMKSANDAAKAVAIDVAGSETTFAEIMTRKARDLGAKNTRFVNASGLPAKGQYTTAYDLALIMHAAKQNPVIVSILRERDASIKTYYGHRYYFKSHNKMLIRGEKVIGKTGWTRRAQHCFVGLIEEGSQEAIVSVLGSRKLWIDLRRLRAQFTGQGSKDLAFGDRGEEVRELQAALKRAGYFKGQPTGYFGKVTKRALIRFQKARKLSADGVAGEQTRNALEPYLT